MPSSAAVLQFRFLRRRREAPSRPKWEGGQYDGDENQQQDVLRLALKLGADYIDVELQRYKSTQAVFKYCDEVDPVGKATGAVNHVVRRQTDGKLCGYNTDCYGAILAIEDGLLNLHSDGSTVYSWFTLSWRLSVLIGAGGVGKSLAYGAKQKGARVVIANLTYDRARGTCRDRVGGPAMSLADLENFHPGMA